MQSLRVVALEGPGDVIGTFRHFQQGQEDPGVTHVTFSGQTFRACRAVGATTLLISQNRRIERVTDGAFTVAHRGDAAAGKRGLAYHAAALRDAAAVVAEIARFRADVVIASNPVYPALLQGLRPFGTRILGVLHNGLWSIGERGGLGSRAQLALARGFYRSGCDAVLCVSEDIKRQVRTLTGTDPTFVDFLPLFRAGTFADVTPPDPSSTPFRVMYAGRVEHAKGVFDLLAVARNLYARGRRDVVFEVCGDGSALPELRAEVARYGLQDTFTLRGWCGHKEMRESLSRAHVVVAPTRREFAEGFNMVIVEALLAGRPVISSRACPALEYVTRGVIEVPSDDMAGYQNAIVSLADDRPRYRELQQGSLASGARFLREDTSFGAALVHCLRAIARGEPVRPRPIDPRAI